MKKNNLKIIKIDKSKSLFNYEKKILINDLILDLKLGYYDFEKEKPQKVKFSLEIDYQDNNLKHLPHMQLVLLSSFQEMKEKNLDKYQENKFLCIQLNVI